MQRKIEKKSFLCEIIVSELIVLNCLYKEDNTCHRQSMCKQTVLRFFIALTETYSNGIMSTGMNKYDEGSVLKISTVFGPFCHVFCGRDLLNEILQTFIESPF